MVVESSVEETKLWTREQRRREINRVLVGALLVFTVLNTILNWVSIVDRRKIHEAEQVTSERLDARAEIHITMLAAYADNLRPLTEGEKNRILALWRQARYPDKMRPFLERIERATDQTIPAETPVEER